MELTKAMANDPTVSNVMLIREFFSVPNKPVTLQEMKELTSENRQELAAAIREQLNAN